jgi:translocation and assembly module TamB
MDFSFSGSMTARQVTVYDSSNAVIGTSDQVVIRFGLWDLLSGNFSPEALQSVTVDNPVILVDNKDGRWNWEDLFKSEPGQPLKYRGRVQINQGAVATGSLDHRRLEAVNGTIDFAQYPALALDLTAKRGTSPLAAKGSWSFEGDGKLDIKTDQFSLSDLPLDEFPQADFTLSGGVVKNLLVTATQQAGKLSFSGSGAVEKLAANIAGFDLSEGKGKFDLTDAQIGLHEITILLNGQGVAIDGTISMAKPGFNIVLNVSSDHFDPAAIVGDSFQGPIAFNAKIEGPAITPLAKGQFSIPQGSFAAVTFTNVSGNFSYNAGVLTLSDTRGNAWDGTLEASGEIVPSTRRYKMSVDGSGVDSALLTEKDIKGRVNFVAYISGQGTTGGNAEGSFNMGEGSFSGIPFTSLTGNFVKQGDKVSFSNITVHTLAGTFHAEGYSEGTIVRLKQLDDLVKPRDIVEKALTDQLKRFIR